METWELIARESIRDLVARYNANGDTGRFEQVLELFADDAVMDIRDGTFEGHERIRTIFTGAAKRTGQGSEHSAAYIRHCTSTHQIDLIDESHARGRCYYYVLTDRGLDHWGRYVDEYRRVGDRWLFSHRRVTTDGAVPGGWADAAASGG